MSALPRSTTSDQARVRPPRPTRLADQPAAPAGVVAAIAIASLAAASIHITAAIVDAGEGTATLLFFAGVAAAQSIWGVTSLVRAPRAWLALGSLGNLAVAAVWVWSRTAGLPVGAAPGVALPATFPDTVATVLEVGIALGGGALAIRGHRVDRAAARAPAVTALAALLLGALAVVAVLAQSGAIPALPAGT